MPSSKRTRYRMNKQDKWTPPPPMEYAENGAALARYAGTCYWCGDRVHPGSPVRFRSGQVLHDGPCSLAVHETNADARPAATKPTPPTPPKSAPAATPVGVPMYVGSWVRSKGATRAHYVREISRGNGQYRRLCGLVVGVTDRPSRIASVVAVDNPMDMECRHCTGECGRQGIRFVT